MAGISSILVYFSLTDRAENSVPVIVTLSSEQLMGLGYTSESAVCDDDIWEDEAPSRPVQTSVTGTAIAFPIDINAATAEELMNINGIGEVTAEKIISYREENGCFCSLDDLLNVEGIGSKKFADIKDYLYIDSEIAAKAAETAVSESALPESREETSTVSVSAVLPGEPDLPLDLNTASAEELMSISGVGEATAEAIIEYANTVGFDDVSDLMNISGIGEKRFEAIAPYVYVKRSHKQSNSENSD